MSTNTTGALWWGVILPKPITLSKVRVHTSGTVLTIQGSDDDITYTDIVTNVATSSAWQDITLPATYAYKYYKFWNTDLWDWTLYSIEGYAGEPVAPPPADDLFRGLHTAAGNVTWQVGTTDMVNDGDDTTAWHPSLNLGVGMGWRVDMPSALAINKIRLRQYGASQLTVRGSYDNSNWTVGLPRYK
jgi:hypothetical protein